MIERYHFDRSKPFYPLVISYLAKLHGLKATLCFRSSTGIRSEIQSDSENLKLLGPLDLRVRGDSNSLSIPAEQVADELVSNLSYLLPIYVQSAQYILTGAHEAMRQLSHSSKALEFLRHARNAAAYNGYWHLLNGEPRRPAEWRGLVLSASDHGSALLKLFDQPGSLELGDPVALLWDIEQQCTGAPVRLDEVPVRDQGAVASNGSPHAGADGG